MGAEAEDEGGGHFLHGDFGLVVDGGDEGGVLVEEVEAFDVGVEV